MKPWMLWMLITIVLWGVTAFLRKPVATQLGVGGALVAEVAGAAFAAITIVLFLRGQPLTLKMPASLYGVAIGFLAVIGVYFLYRALQVGPVSVITPFSALAAVITVFLGFLFLHERLTVMQGAGVVFAIIAAVLLGL